MCALLAGGVTPVLLLRPQLGRREQAEAAKRGWPRQRSSSPFFPTRIDDDNFDEGLAEKTARCHRSGIHCRCC